MIILRVKIRCPYSLQLGESNRYHLSNTSSGMILAFYRVFPAQDCYFFHPNYYLNI